MNEAAVSAWRTGKLSLDPAEPHRLAVCARLSVVLSSERRILLRGHLQPFISHHHVTHQLPQSTQAVVFWTTLDSAESELITVLCGRVCAHMVMDMSHVQCHIRERDPHTE